MSDPIAPTPGIAPPSVPTRVPTADRAASTVTAPPSGPESAASQFQADPRKRGTVPAVADEGGISWGRLGIAAGMAPIAYVNGVLLHEAVGHGGMALALGASDITIDPLPHSYTRDDGTQGFRMASMTYMPGKDWGDAQRTAVMLGPSMLDTAIMAGGTALYESGHWPSNRWASGALFVTQSAAAVDLAFNGAKGMVNPGDSGLDTVKAAHGLGIHPSLLGGIQTGVAVAGAVELVRIGYDVFRDKPQQEAKGPTAMATVSPLAGGGGIIGVAGTF